MHTNNKTKTVERIYDFIVWYKREYDGIAPSFHEIMEAVELKSKSPIKRHVETLIADGRLKRHPHVKEKSARCLMVTGGEWKPSEREGNELKK